MKGKNKNVLSDPSLVQNRIFIRNLPACTRDEVESICSPYGNVLAIMVQKNFSFVQFDSEESANKAANALNNSMFKGLKISAKMAQYKPQKQQENKMGDTNNQAGPNQAASNQNTNTANAGNGSPSANAINDCEIIVIDRKNTKYAEYIEERLKNVGLRVDVLFPNQDVSLGKVLSSISSRGVFYAVLVTNQHEEHQSITVNILYGQPAEHRNMPLEDAVALISDDFKKKLAADSRQLPSIPNLNTLLGMLPKALPILGATTSTVSVPNGNRHPEGIQLLLNHLVNNMPLTALQYDHVIKYLNEKREKQMQAELGDYEPKKEQAPDPEIEMQKKIKDILNKPSIADNTHQLLYENFKAVKEDAQIMKLLKDIKIQNALDMLMNSNIVTTIEAAMKF